MGYYEKGDFDDPVVRCAQCSKLVHREFIDKHGACNHCGNKRFNNVTGLNSEEYFGLKKGRYDLGLSYEMPDEWIADWAEVK